MEEDRGGGGEKKGRRVGRLEERRAAGGKMKYKRSSEKAESGD